GYAGQIKDALHNRWELLRDKYSINSIQIFDENVETMDLNLSEETKERLIESGRKATWAYVDTYLGSGVIYNHLPKYKDIHEKYYSKGPVELDRILQEEIMPLIQEINALCKLFGTNLQEKLDEVKQKLSQFSTDEIKRQEKLYDEAEQLAKQLETSQDEAIIQRYLELKKKMNNEIIELIHDRLLLEYLMANNVIQKLRDTESVLHEHIDIILDALAAHQRDYPDPRASEDFEHYLYLEKEKFRKIIFDKCKLNYQLDDVVSETRAKEHIDLFEDLLRFGVKLNEAKLLTENYFSIVNVMSQRTAGAVLLDHEKEKLKQEARERLFSNILVKELKAQRLISLTASADELKEVQELWCNVVNHYLVTDATLSRGYAEYLAKKRIIKMYQEKNNQFDMAQIKEGEAKENTERYTFNVNLRKTVARLCKGKWDEIVLTNHADVAHNLTEMQVVEGETFGKHESVYLIKTFEFKFDQVEHYQSIQKEFPAPPVKAYFLTPDPNLLQNPAQPLKEIIIAFDQPFSEESEKQFGLIAKYSRSREHYFNQCKAELLQKLQLAIQQAKKLGLRPPQAKFKITLTGEGLAGQDAQYMFSAIIDELLADPEHSDFKDILDIELNLADPSRVTADRSKECANHIAALKKKKDISITGYNLIHQHSFAGRPSRKRMQNYIGEENILSRVPKEDAFVEADFRDKYDSSFQYKRADNQTTPKLLERVLNKTKLIYTSEFFRLTYVHLKSIRRLTEFLLQGAFSASVFVLIKLPFNIGTGLIKRLINPFVKIHHYLNKKPLPVSRHQSWAKHLRTSTKQLSKKSSKKFVTEKEVTDFVHQAEPSQRLQREKRPPIKHVVLEGARMKGYAYPSALIELEKKRMLSEVQDVAGSADGGMIAALWAVGYTPQQLEAVMEQIDFKDLLDEPFSLGGLDEIVDASGMKIGVNNIIYLLAKKGLYNGEAFETLFERLVKIKLE
ncbi:MAG: hypothetical protein ACHQJ6_07030, partial [Candidatus Berkiellales bacterium]